MRRVLIALVLVLPVIAIPSLSAHAATFPTASYAPAWNMVGAPPGTDFTPAEALFIYQNGQYANAPSRIATTCQGYWAYFATTALIPLPATDVNPSQTCALAVGWTMVGNPFTAPATLPSATTAWWWNTTTQSYQLVNQIPAGASVWIYSTTGGSITLGNSAAVSPSPTPSPTPTTTTTIINASSALGSYTVHAGSQIEVLVLTSTPSNVTTNTAYLKLLAAGITEDISCTTTSCAPGIEYDFWSYQALQTGTTAIVIGPRCLQANPPCAQPSRAIQITIVP